MLPTAFPTADRPHVTRYGRRRRATVASRVWAGTSVALAAAGVAAVVVLPQDPAPARLEVPAAVAAPAAAPALPVAAPAPTPAEQAVTAPLVLQTGPSTPSRVQIPALGIASSVIELGLERDGSMEVPRGAYPVGWFDGGPTPGELGPAVLAGHVDWAGEPGAFYGLRELVPGDEVVVDRDDGTQLTFLVDRVEEHPKDEFPTDDVYGDIGIAGLRLITCGGAFDEDSGDYLDNVVVFASLVSVT
ncbi:class F sortase [Modestobacter sp. Leaf380]|uniref:class F sortase n=1 Tax=Modestobacter sp. Leaf380 TaxID=1736356 RepID=UPI0009E8D93E|nr:class F sortase [Modestobacter sp. Leaf380]